MDLRFSTRGSLNTRFSIALVLFLALGACGWLLSNGYFPFRLRSDGLYAGSGKSTAEVTVEKPRLELPAPASARSGHVRVLRVVDGDTLVVFGDERVRLIGVNCDEIGHERIDENSAGWKQAQWVYEQLKPDAQVRLVYDKERLDKYERTLAYAYLPDGTMLNELLLKEGMARVMSISPNTKHAKKFAALEQEARRAGKGVWAN